MSQSIEVGRKVPRGEARRRELAAVAEKVFLERGFANTTMQMIASHAGASKETLYRHFVSKEALLAEVVRARSSRFLWPDGVAPTGRPAHVLTAYGTNLLKAIFSPEATCLFRVVVAEAPHAPELGEVFYEQGPARVFERLTQYLRDAHAQGHLNCRKPAQAAKLFLGAVVTDFHLRRLVHPNPPPLKDAEARAHVRAAVAMFLAKYGVE